VESPGTVRRAVLRGTRAGIGKVAAATLQLLVEPVRIYININNTAILPNGIRVVTEEVPYVQSVALGIWVDTGARDETEEHSGISHFIEHLLFKGTERRTALQIAEEFDAVGGQLNAFTDKEYTCFYAKVLPEHTGLALDVIADMLCNSLLDPEEVEREKNVVIEEIKRHEDTPDELIHDIFLETLWPGHPLGRSVIGRPEVIAALTRDDIVDYVRRHYLPQRMVIAAAGNLSHGSLLECIERYFGGMNGAPLPRTPVAPAVHAGTVEVSRSTEQVHFCVGTRGFNQDEDDRYPLGLIDTAVGGGMSSRLFQEVREKRGLCYAIGSYTASYREAGMFAVYAGTSPENASEVRTLIQYELQRLAQSGLGEAELQRAKNQIRGAVLLGLDSMSGRMTRLGKSMLYYDRVISPFEVVEKVEAVTADDVRRVCGSLFSGDYAYAAVGPFDEEDAEA
jgi:predicted Zn-dependent peptidase